MQILQISFLAFDLIIFFMVCSVFLKRKNIKNKLQIIGILTAVIFSFLIVIYIDTLLLKYLALTLLISLLMRLLFYDNMLNISLVVISVYGLFFITDYFGLVLIETKVNVHEFIKYPKNLFLAYSLSRIFDCLIIATLFLKKSKIILKSRYVYIFILVSFLTISGLVSLMIPSKNKFIPNKYLIPFILVFNNFFIYYMLREFIKISSKLKIKSVAEERARSELKLWQKLREKDIVQRKMMHDYSNTLICINGLLEKDDLNGAKKYLKNISAEYKLAKSFISTGNTLLDVLINTKYEKSLENNITMILKLDDLRDIRIQNEDLIVLISNLLDNAIEYCLKLEKSKRKIFLSISNTENLEIFIRNPLENKVIIRDSLIKTTKKDKKNHGLGLINIKDIVEKYKGEHYIDVDDEYFTYYIEI